MLVFLCQSLECETMILITRALEVCLCAHAQMGGAQSSESDVFLNCSLPPLHLFIV